MNIRPWIWHPMPAPTGRTSSASMSGASPGGVAVLAVVPEHDFAFAAFGNDPRAMQLHDKLLLTLLHDRFGVQPQELSADEHQAADLAPYAGTYRSNQLRVDVRVVDCGLEKRRRMNRSTTSRRGSPASPAPSRSHPDASYTWARTCSRQQGWTRPP